MTHGVLCHSEAFHEYANLENEMTVFEFLEYSICGEILILKFQVTQAPFVCIIFKVLQN